MSLELRALGYLVLGACWHPELINNAERYKQAGEYLSKVVEQPFNQPKSPEELTVQIVDAHMAVITDPKEFTTFGLLSDQTKSEVRETILAEYIDPAVLEEATDKGAVNPVTIPGHNTEVPPQSPNP